MQTGNKSKPKPPSPTINVRIVNVKCGILAFLLCLLGFLYAVLYLRAPNMNDKLSRFEKALAEYDVLFDALHNDAPRYNILVKKLAALESLVFDMASRTAAQSLLKRERAFSQISQAFRAQYKKTLKVLHNKYVDDAVIMSLALEDALKDGVPSMQDALSLTEKDDSEGAAFTVEDIADFFAGVAGFADGAREAALLDSVLLGILDRIPFNAAQTLAPFLASNPQAPPRQMPALPHNTLLFAAAYAYDAREYALAADFFAALPDAASQKTAGDAFYLAGDKKAAAAAWLASSSPAGLYNYASVAENSSERRYALENLAAKSGQEDSAPFIYALVLYSRLLDAERAVKTLEAAQIHHPLLDLEIWRRTESALAPDRAAPELWRVISLHQKDAQVYEYAAWYFGKERKYDELSLLLKNAALQQVDSAVLQFWNAFLAARAPDNKAPWEAFSMFDSAAGQTWYTAANAARFYEAAHRWGDAVSQYNAALRWTEPASPAPRERARILRRLANCLAMQGKSEESRAALEEALSLDPSNISVRSSFGAR